MAEEEAGRTDPTPSEDKSPVEQQAVEGGEPPAQFGAGHGPAESDTGGEPEVTPGPGGYAGRDPKSEMPAIPSVPETQEEIKTHDAAPPQEDPEAPASHD